jgi:succinate dehydrogenase/fumarate reductase flavoprotein subunit
MTDPLYTVIEASGVPRWDDSADVVIAGLGVAGACAAIEARGAGADVLVLERASGGGGTTLNAAGHVYLGGGTRVQKAVGVEDDVQDMYTYLTMNTPEPEADKIRLYCDESVAHFDWLVAQGVPFNDTMFHGKHFMQMTDECLIWSGNEEAWPFREKARPAPRGHKVAKEGEGGGALMMERLVARMRELGVRIEVDSAVQQLVRDGDRITGVRVKHFDAVKSVSARGGVILATGHFTANQAMLARYTPRLLEEGITRQYTPYDDGAGHQLGLAAGGVLLHMDGALITSPFYPPEQLIQGILVNRAGQRFVAEDSYHSRSSIYATQQPGGEAYLIVDEKIFARPLFGHEVVDAWESVAEMERGLGIPDGALQRTLRVYNEHAVRGEDPEFHKKGKWVVPIEQPPFAAIQFSRGKAAYMGFTLGGLCVSIDAEVLRADGSAVPGLYAAGACAANIAQDGAGYSSGTCIGESSFFGRRAGRHAAAPSARERG